MYHSGTVGACLSGRNGFVSGVAVSQSVTGFGVEGQAWDEMLVGQRWESAAQVASAFVGGMVASPTERPVVVNINVPNLPLEEIEGWSWARVGVEPPRRLANAVLAPRPGHDGLYSITMSWGDAQELPEDTDGGIIERNRVAVSYLSRLTDEEPPDGGRAAAALDALWSS